jgi:hypothetical protein
MPAGPQALSAMLDTSCAPKANFYTRTAYCLQFGVSVTLYKGSTAQGKVTFTLTQAYHLSTTSRHFYEHISISSVKATGAASGVHLSVKASCGSPCSLSNHFPQGKTAAAMSGDISYADSVGAGKAAATKTTYTWSASKSGYATATFTYSTPISYRCDQALGPVAGCVFPSYAPYQSTLASLPDVAANIAKAQGGPGHYGQPGSSHPLHRITSSGQQSSNYWAVCSSSVVGQAPAGTSCDAYPFKSAREGGKALSSSNRSTAFVPASQESSETGKLNFFYNANRVLNGDAFWVLV